MNATRDERHDWIVIGPGGNRFPSTRADTRAESIARFMSKLATSLTWKQHYDIGYRCARVRRKLAGKRA